jgi:hypothetical protein
MPDNFSKVLGDRRGTGLKQEGAEPAKQVAPTASDPPEMTITISLRKDRSTGQWWAEAVECSTPFEERSGQTARYAASQVWPDVWDHIRQRLDS